MNFLLLSEGMPVRRVPFVKRRVKPKDILNTPFSVFLIIHSAAVFEDLKTIVRPEVPTVVVANKMDWNPYFKPEELLALFGESPPKIEVVTISALQQMNMEHLKNTLYELAIGHSLTGESTIVSNSRHYDALRQAEERLAAAREGLQLGVTGDLLAMDIRQALNYLGMITGEISTDDLLERIFSDFCIGK